MFRYLNPLKSQLSLMPGPGQRSPGVHIPPKPVTSDDKFGGRVKMLDLQ